ncbi:MAG: TetR/AcrR family transcriptional regulator, partial [Anaerovoracaceae bacterium]
MKQTKEIIVDTFWQLLEEKSYNKITVRNIVDRCQVNRNTFYYHFQDIPSLAEHSIEDWADKVIKSKGVFGSPVHCLTYMADECMKRKKAFLHLYHSAQKESFLLHLNKMGYHIIHSFITNTTENIKIPEENKAIL